MTEPRVAQHANVVFIKDEATDNMAVDFYSEVIDFRDMARGSLQVVWSGVDQADGVFVAYGSNFRDLSTFDDICGTPETVETPSGKRLWNLMAIGYRYAVVKWTKNSVTTGQCHIVALGKKH